MLPLRLRASRAAPASREAALMKWLILYTLTIPAANWAIETFGVVPIGFGLMAPAGVFAAGLAFTLRDLVQDRLGKPWAIGAIGLGALLSLAVSAPFVAAASATAFLISELADMVVYTPLRRRGWIRAVVASNAVGSVVDSAAFLLLAFGSLDFLTGQVVGKWLMILPVAAGLWITRRPAWHLTRSPSTPTVAR
jgi:queuosine precursor transporter